MTGRYIAFEGPDLVGKTTQANLLRAWLLEEHGIDSIYAQQPGATNLGSQLRHIVKHEKRIEIGTETEAMIFVLDQMAFVENIARGALDAGKWIVSDRSNNISGLVYQVLHGVKPSRLDEFYSVVPSPRFDIVFLLRADPEKLIPRTRDDPKWDRYESNKDFMNKVYSAYDSLLDDHGDRIAKIARECVCIDASKTVDEVFSEVKNHLLQLL
jgi:dTMP kinase